MEDGPTLLLTSTEHGNEIQGIEVIRKVTRHQIDPKTLKGAIIAIPVANPLAYMHQLYTSFLDNPDVSQVDATTKEDAPITGRLANAIWENTYKKADMVINIHTNVRTVALIFQIVNTSQPKTQATVKKMAEAFGVTAIYEGEEGKLPPAHTTPNLETLALRHAIPWLMIELIDGIHISEPSTTVGVRGILNVMKAFNMIPGTPEPHTEIPIVPGRNRYHKMVRCNRGGIIQPTKIPGEFNKQGEVIARIYDVWGNEVEAPIMPVDGYIWAYPLGYQLGTSGGLQTVSSGDDVAYIFIPDKK